MGHPVAHPEWGGSPLPRQFCFNGGDFDLRSHTAFNICDILRAGFCVVRFRMTATIETAAHIALLAPVPLEHLVDGQKTAESEGKVAFGSRAWEVFRELDTRRKGMPVDVYIYASHSDGQREFEVSWHGRYVGHVEGRMGAHPDGMK